MAQSHKHSKASPEAAFTHAVLFVRPDSRAAARTTADVVACLQQIGMEFSMASDDGEHKFDLGIAVGGDGTMLHAAREALTMGIPLVGVNTGRLGFLTDIPAAEISAMLPPILAGEFIPEHRLSGEVTVLREDKVISRSIIINEATIQKEDVSRMCELEVQVDGRFMLRQRGDGIIIATPTGSTAYALACNGPIVHPALNALTMVLVSPHQLAYRPLCFAAEHTVQLKTISPGVDTVLTVDGATVQTISSEDVVNIRGSDRKIHIIHPDNYDYFRMLREKLKWGNDIC